MPVHSEINIPEELRPLSLPELGGFELTWAFCRNRMCRNFGVLYGAAAEPDPHYSCRPATQGGEITGLDCRWCGAYIRLYPPASVKPLVRHFLRQSIPFATCPNESCENYTVNAFAHFWGRPNRPGRPYKVVNPAALKCNLCKRTFPLGTARVLRDTRKIRIGVTQLLHSVGEARSVTDARGSGIPVSTYYRRLHRSASRLRDYHAYRNAHILKPGFCGSAGKTAIVHTDVVQSTLRRRGKRMAQRSQQLKVIVSVLRVEGTYYVLAAHPFFLAHGKSKRKTDRNWPTDDELEKDRLERSFMARRTEGVWSLLDNEPVEDETKPNRVGPKVPDGSQRGLFLKSPYAETAHFLVVRRLLARFPRVQMYMDADPAQHMAAMVAMREEVKAGKVNIALMQFQKTGPKREMDFDALEEELREVESENENLEEGKPPRTRRNRALKKALREMEARFAEAVVTPPTEEGEEDAKSEPLVGLGPDPQDLERTRAALWGAAARGANSKVGGFAWLEYPPDTTQYRQCKTLWLTRRPSDTLEDANELLLPITLQSVDSLFDSIRSRTDSIDRPGAVADGSGIRDVNYSAEVICSELAIYLVRRNYGRRPGVTKTTHIPAVVMGMTEGKRIPIMPHKTFWDFHLDVRRAKELSRWLAQT